MNAAEFLERAGRRCSPTRRATTSCSASPATCATCRISSPKRISGSSTGPRRCRPRRGTSSSRSRATVRRSRRSSKRSTSTCRVSPPLCWRWRTSSSCGAAQPSWPAATTSGRCTSSCRRHPWPAHPAKRRTTTSSSDGIPTPNGIRIGLVYTPAEQRGNGYAAAVTADVSRRQLERGRFCFLYTDATNTAAERIYARLGYTRVCESRQYAFR